MPGHRVHTEADAGMRLFCYGTLQFDSIMREVSGHRCSGVPAVLDHYACFTVRGEVFPGIVPARRAHTPGLLYSGLGAAAMRRLDSFESDYYARERVAVREPAGRLVPAWAYVVRPDARGRLSEQAWDREWFEREQLDIFLRRISREGSWWARR